MFDHLRALAHHFIHVDTVLVASSWLTGIMGAGIHYKWQHKTEDRKSLKNFVKFCFPEQLWKLKSCKQDYIFMFFNHIIESFTIVPLMIGIVGASTLAYSSMRYTFGDISTSTVDYPLWIVLLLFVLLIQDFSTWFTHWVEHKIPVMWALHSVHHSVEFLNPLSNRRHHPLQLVWEGSISNILSGFFIGFASYAFHVKLIDNLFLGIDGYYLASVLSFYQLRHSHIPLHYGKFEKYFLSPANHQLHHSVETADWDVNFGLLTSIWDRLFKTMKYTKPGYTYRLGLEPELQRQYKSVLHFWFVPFVNIGKHLWSKALPAKVKAPTVIENAIEQIVMNKTTVP